MLPRRGHRTPSPFSSGRELLVGGFRGSDSRMTNLSLMGHRLPTKEGHLQSVHIRTQTKYASAASAKTLLHRIRPASTQAV